MKVVAVASGPDGGGGGSVESAEEHCQRLSYRLPPTAPAARDRQLTETAAAPETA